MDRIARWRRSITSGFSLALGLLVAADRHVGLISADASVLGIVAGALVAVIGLSALVLLVVWAYRGFRSRSIAMDAVFFVGSLLGAELLWRFVVNDLPENGFKLVAVALVFAQPLIAALGVAAAALAIRPLGAVQLPTQPGTD